MRIIIGFAILIVIAVVVIVLGVRQLKEYKTGIDNLMSEIDNNRQVVYVVKDEVSIKKGDVLISEGETANIMRQEIYSGLEAEYYITEDDVGTLAIVDMEPGTPILKNMVTPIIVSHDTREIEISSVHLMVDQKANDYIDIRIVYPNGENYCVIPKRRIKKLVLDSNIFYADLNEEEILRLSGAIVDAYLITGTKLYTTRYVESNIQNEAIPDYKVSAAIMDLMSNNPNIVSLAQETLNLSARLSLEQRLKGLTQEQLAAVAQGHGIEDTAKASVLTSEVKIQLADFEDEQMQNSEDAAEPGNLQDVYEKETTESQVLESAGVESIID